MGRQKPMNETKRFQMGGLKAVTLRDKQQEPIPPAYEIGRKPFLKIEGKPSKFAQKVPNREFYQARNSTRDQIARTLTVSKYQQLV